MEDTNNTETYTIVLVREASAPTADPDAIWTANLTVGIGEDSATNPLVGYAFNLGSTSWGAIAPATFDVDSKTIGVTAFQYDYLDQLNFVHAAIDPGAILGDANYVLHVGDKSFDIAAPGTRRDLALADAGLTWTYGQIVLVKLVLAPNTVASGLPAITGAAQAGKTLTATVGTIADADGLPTTFPGDYTVQWVRVDADGSSNETNIGSDSDTYTLVTADVGKKIRVKVSFTDNGGTAEGPLTSEAYPSYANVMAAKGNCPTGNDWCATMRLGYDPLTHAGTLREEIGYADTTGYGQLNPAEFTHGGTTYPVESLFLLRDTTVSSNIITRADLSIAMDGAELPDGTVLNVGGQAFTVDADSDTTQLAQELWNLLDLGLSLNWADGGEVAVSANLPPGLDTAIVDGASLVLTYHENLNTGSVPAASAYSVVVDAGSVSNAASDAQTSTYGWTIADGSVYRNKDNTGLWEDYANSKRILIIGTVKGNTNVAATGTPAITGAAQAGKTLTATVGTIADADGLPTTFPGDYTVQWVRVDADGSSNETNIGSDSDTYTLVTADVGKKIRVKVSFTDNGGTAEGPLTSDAYPSHANVMAAKGNCPTGNDWCATLTLGEKDPLLHAGT